MASLKDESNDYSNILARVLMWLVAVLCVSIVFAIFHVAFPHDVEQQNITQSHTTLQIAARMVNEYLDTDNTCHIVNCSIVCQNSSQIYDDVFQALQDSECSHVIINIKNQFFPNNQLQNKWRPTKKSVKKILILNSFYRIIQNEAFNCLDFSTTEHLTLTRVDLNVLNNGVLLGFANLRFLNIRGQIRSIHRCFFQPVQATLIRLRLNAELIIPGDINVFGISRLPNLKGLDLSDNIITGSLNRSFFKPVPNVKYVSLSNARISFVDVYAFDDIAENLSLMDLSKNSLNYISSRPIEILLSSGNVNFYLLGNDWLCNCNLKPLIGLYAKFENRFADIPYCISPANLYGVLLSNVTFDENCIASSVLGWNLGSTQINIFKTELSSTVLTSPIAIEASLFQMNCEVNSESIGDEEVTPPDHFESFSFSPPIHKFEINLLENNSVHIELQKTKEAVNIIWFSEAIEDFVHTMSGITVDYNCVEYTAPYLIIDDLEENCTYTFCLVPSGAYSITPFNCLPLHVPSATKNNNDVWISNDDKHLTVGVVCFVFMCSMLLGGIIAFFGIKTFPGILEGSSNVLVVKKSDQACYVSTITEVEYMHNRRIEKNSLKKQTSSLTTLFPPCSKKPHVISKGQQKSEVENLYETPFTYDKSHNCEFKCKMNQILETPMTPPPLPKRNSDFVLYSSQSDLFFDVPYPKMSL